MKKILEVCCGSYEDAINAKNGGAYRIELNAALYLGGITPSIATAKLVSEKLGIETIAMLRPRGAGFCYTDNEFEVIRQDAVEFMKIGVSGLAFGFIKNDRSIDIERTAIITELIHSYNRTAVFHRAIDCTADMDTAIQQLIEIGVDRILTSGGEENAEQGIESLADIQAKYGEKIEILAGAGINEDNMLKILDKTGVNQIHSSCKIWLTDNTTETHKVSYAYSSGENRSKYDAVSVDRVRKMIDLIQI